jgi:hypothetical protein
MLNLYQKFRTALCISGQMRNYEQCYDNLYENLIKQLKPDVFIHTWRNRGCSAILNNRSPENVKKKACNWDKFYNDIINENNLIDLYKPRKLIIEDYQSSYEDKIENTFVPNWIKEDYKKNKIDDGLPWKSHHVGSVLPMFYKIMKSNELKDQAELEDGRQYDLVIRFRADQIIGKIPFECFLNLDTVWCNENIGSPLIPGTNKMQVSDRYAFGSSRAMNIYCSLFNSLNIYWRDEFEKNPKFDSWEYPIGDRLLRKHLMNFNQNYETFGPFAPIYRP